jgi:hypothetical protein
VQSYDEHMDFGMMADAAAMPDVSRFALAVGEAYEEMRQLPVAMATPQPPEKSRAPSRLRKAAAR